MDRCLRNMVLVLCVWLSLAGVCFGKQVYLKDGGVIDCKSFRRHGNSVTVIINRDTVVDLQQSEINMGRTFRKTGKKAHQIQRNTAAATAKTPAVQPAVPPAAAVTAKPPAKPVAAVAPLPAAAAKPTPTPAAAGAAKPAPPPGPLPDPVKKEVAAAQAVAAEPPALPDKADLESRRQQAKAMMTEALQKNDPELMKKAVELQRSTLQPEDRDRAAGMSLKIMLILLICSLLIVVSMWVTFEKAGSSGWKSLIPFYNVYVLMEISGKPGWWMFVTLIPLVGVVFYLLAMLALAEKFGRGALFGIGLAILPMFLFPVLAFGGAEYEAEETFKFH